MANVSLTAERLVSAPPAKTLAVVRTPTSYASWVPGVVDIQDETGDGQFTCLFRFSVFNLKFKVTMTELDEAVTRFSTSAVIIGKVDATVAVARSGVNASQVTVTMNGLFRSSVMHRMAVSLFEKGADVVSQRLSNYLGNQRAA